MWRRAFETFVRFVRRLLLGAPPGAGPTPTPQQPPRNGTGPPNYIDLPSAEPPIRPATSGEVPRIRTYEGLGIPFSASSDPRIQQLRRAAVIQIFELAGLGVVPGQFWPFLDRMPAPGDAVINFLAAIGVDPDLVRRNDPEEVTKANEVLDLLVDIDGAFDRLNDQARAEIQTAIWCGEYERVREAAQVVKTYTSILELGDAFPPGQRFPAFTQFLQDVAAELDNPMTAEKSDADAAERIRLNMAALLRQLSDARAEQDRLVEALWAEFPDWQSSSRSAAITLGLSRVDAILTSILNEPNSVEDVGELLTHFDKSNSELHSLLASLAADRQSKSHRSRGSSGGRSRSGSAPGSSSPGLLDRALAYFGLDRSCLPTRAAFRTIKRQFQFRTHPDRGGSSDAFRECMDYAAVVEDHLAPA